MRAHYDACVTWHEATLSCWQQTHCCQTCSSSCEPEHLFKTPLARARMKSREWHYTSPFYQNSRPIEKNQSTTYCWMPLLSKNSESLRSEWLFFSSGDGTTILGLEPSICTYWSTRRSINSFQQQWWEMCCWLFICKEALQFLDRYLKKIIYMEQEWIKKQEQWDKLPSRESKHSSLLFLVWKTA